MEHDEYLDLLKRLLGLSELVIDLSAATAGITAVLISKGICTEKEIVEAKDAMCKSSPFKEATQRLHEMQTEIEEAEKNDPYKMFEDFINNIKKENKNETTDYFSDSKEAGSEAK